MKAILTRLFNHEELTSEETKQILLNITKEMYPEAQIAALLTAFQMRSITVDELIGFREALMETRLPIDFAPYRPIEPEDILRANQMMYVASAFALAWGVAIRTVL